MTTSTPLLLVDGHNLLYRAWYGFPARIQARSAPRDLTGVFGFAALLRKAHLAHASGSEIFVVFDAENGSAARADEDAAYKAHRPAPEPGLIESLADIRRVLDLASVRWIEQDGCEGDDVIATLTATARTEDRAVDIMSVDKDFYQLLADPRVRVLNTMLAESRRLIDGDAVHACFQVTADQWPDYRALTGDESDNIAGIRGIGPTTAARLLASGRRLEHIPHQQIRPAWRAQWDDAVRWREMIRLDSKVELPEGLLTGQPTVAMPRVAELLEILDLW
ncbi:5'-3' exonuclease [Streptomyces olivoreticuli]|uniref:5'-3' exonuclease n=1 Tax=Streptomyces olivoreticuli TaxID=68246 RepID=UPI000E26589C|nr:5'-3' exonuclease H3TH domain-containing protein [Streptomyces olivoreticuli]